MRDMAQIASMLVWLGYDRYANPPNYSNPDPIVVNNTHRVLKGDYETPANQKGYLQAKLSRTEFPISLVIGPIEQILEEV
ncbi:hypothetical protein CB1_000743065 [Camelus ferus]|nr:hypothetical protein CB1_000743065 [Camelus ferus]